VEGERPIAVSDVERAQGAVAWVRELIDGKQYLVLTK
jgi:hypothetical protein